jgi:hypothetical protein
MALRILNSLFGTLLAVARAMAVYIAVSGKDLLRVATGSVSHALCAATFVSGLDPDQRPVYKQEELPANGMRWIDWALH